MQEDIQAYLNSLNCSSSSTFSPSSKWRWSTGGQLTDTRFNTVNNSIGSNSEILNISKKSIGNIDFNVLFKEAIINSTVLINNVGATQYWFYTINSLIDNGSYVTMGLTRQTSNTSVLPTSNQVFNLQFLVGVRGTNGVNSIIKGTQYTYVAGNGTPTENATELQTAYNLAKLISGLSATNRFKIIVGTGKYQFTDQFAIDTQYIDLVSLTGDADVEFTNGINVTANNVFLKGLKTSLVFELANNLNLLICDTCVGGDYSFGRAGFSGGLIVSGRFTNCIGGYRSFGGYNGTASGSFTNCTGSDYSFGEYSASGIFNNCTALGWSFGGITSGTFTNCSASYSSFGLIDLIAKLFFCRLTSGTFQTVSSGGRTYYCIDGNGNTNNQ